MWRETVQVIGELQDKWVKLWRVLLQEIE